MPHAPILASLTAAFVALSACAGTGPVAQGDFAPSYEGIQTVLLQDDMVSFRVALQGARGNDDVETYGRCAAAQYALIRGFGFARHVRTTVAQDRKHMAGGRGLSDLGRAATRAETIDAEVTVRDCGALGIPTI